VTKVAPLLVTVTLLSACGYALAGRGSSLPDHIRRIGVPMFENQSQIPELDRVLTEAVQQELRSKGRYLIVQEATGVDAVLTGTVRPVSLTVSAFTDARQAQRYLVTVLAEVEFKDVRENKVIFSRAVLRASEEYEAIGTAAVNDASALFSQDQNALNRIAKTFARTVVTSILEAF